MDLCDCNLSDVSRDDNGFLCLSVSLSSSSKELRGNQRRSKHWVRFLDKEVLVKSSFYLDKPNYCYYAELIVMVMARLCNLSCASYDLVKFNDLTGNLVSGVLSYNMLCDGEELVSLYDLVGSSDDDEFLDSTNYYYVIDRLREVLNDYDCDVSSLIRDFKKQLAFSILVLDTDNHIGNFSFIKKGNSLVISPLYDNEASLLLDNDWQVCKDLLGDIHLLSSLSDIAQPRIGCYKDESDGGLGSYWQDTLEALIVDDDIYDFCYNVLGHELDMDYVFDLVEDIIHCSLPLDVKLLSKYAYLRRLKVFKKILLGDI